MIYIGPINLNNIWYYFNDSFKNLKYKGSYEKKTKY